MAWRRPVRARTIARPAEPPRGDAPASIVAGMEVLRLHGAEDVRVHEEPEPIPAPGEELVSVTAVGLCGSDLHWYEDGGIGEAQVVEPLVLGHEMGGLIVSGPRAGERVVVEPANPCGHCLVCRAGDGNLCPDVRFCGHAPVDGGLRTLMSWPQRLLLPCPTASRATTSRSWSRSASACTPSTSATSGQA